ncbi:MAG: glycosyltransferase [Candidatus Nanopelagicales bacterium]
MVDRKILLYGDVNMNIIDGSAVWAASAAEVLARAGVQVYFLLKARPTTDRLLEPLSEFENITIINPFTDAVSRFKSLFTKGDSLSVSNAVSLIEKLHQQESFDAILIRGGKLAPQLAKSEIVYGKLWTYLTDIPQSAAAMDASSRKWLGEVAKASHLMLCQTEYLRALLEATIPQTAGKCVIWSPIVATPPTVASINTADLGTDSNPLSLVYTGKFAPLWNTLEMTQLPAQLSKRGITAELNMIGDKIHNPKELPTWSSEMNDALTKSPGVIWHGGMSRTAAMQQSAKSQIGISWRAAELDASLELSTKVLEFGAMGIPVLLNRNLMHEHLLGSDYPLFVDANSDVAGVIATVVKEPEKLIQAANTIKAATNFFTMENSVTRVKQLLEQHIPLPTAGITEFVEKHGRALRVVVASHDLKFFTKIASYWQGMPGIELRFDHWPAINRNEGRVSKAMLKWADVIVCEWCGGNALWYAKHKKAKQRLIVRLHRFELSRPWPETINGSAVDQLVCVSKPYAELTLAKTSVPKSRVVMVPNWVDVADLNRPKFDDAQFTLGLIGAAPMRKRPDQAIKILEELRKQDPRFKLVIKSKLPWQMPWVWRDEAERVAFRELFEYVERSELLRGSIIFDDYGADVANWLRRIGWVLSTSDDESFHLAPAEGAASGAVPVLLPWPGSDQIYHSQWIHQDVQQAAKFILNATQSNTWAQLGNAAQAEIASRYGLDLVNQQWAKLLTEDLPSVSS